MVVATAVFVLKAADRMPDFEVYWKAGARAAAAEPLYRVEDGHFVFKYLPAFAVLAAPLGLLSLPVAEALWFALSVYVMAALVAASIRLLPERRKPTWVLAVILVVVFGKFYGHELTLGQVNLLFTLVAVHALLALKHGREARAGVLVVLTIVIKPYAVLFLPWLAARRRASAALAAAAGLAVVLAAPALLYGWSGNIAQHRAWWDMVVSTTAPNLSVVDNVSLLSAFTRLLGPGDTAARLAMGVSALLLATAVVMFALRRGLPFPEGLEGGLLLTLMPFLSPQGWDYVFLVSTPAMAYLANYEDRLPRVPRIVTLVAMAAIGLSIYDVIGRDAYRAFMQASMITWLYMVVVAALLALRVRKIA